MGEYGQRDGRVRKPFRAVRLLEALGLLRFGIADYFNCVRDQVLGSEPALDIVRGYPSGQIAQEDGKTHSVIVQLRWWGCASRRFSMKAFLCYHNRQGGK